VLKAASGLQDEGVSVEVVDPRTLYPLDKETILRSVEKTGKLVIVEESCKTGNFGGEVAAIVAEEAFDCLKGPIKRVAAPDTPVPANNFLETLFVPDEKKIRDAVRSVYTHSRR
jgi:pyruvate dehydrogenase E1 component beta subunit